MLSIKKLTKLNIVLMLLITITAPTLTVQAKEGSKDEPKIIVVDPSCQEIPNKKKEPIAPGAFKTAFKTSTGEVGKETGVREYELNLKLAKIVKKNLEDYGYEVVLTRDTNDVDLSNSDRAMMANTTEADLYVVIGTGNNTGVSVKCQTEDNPYTFDNYDKSRLLADTLLGSIVQGAESIDNGVDEVDDYAAINWSVVPTAVVEFGDLSDIDEEAKLTDDEYQKKLAKGIADGIESYFSQR